MSGMQDNLRYYPDPVTTSAIQRLLSRTSDTLMPPSNCHFYLVALDNNRPVGMGALKRCENDVINHTAELTRISVAKEWRGKDVCGMIVGGLIRHAVEKWNVKRVWLLTMSSVKQAVRAYEKLGFEIIDEEEKVDKVRLVKMEMTLAQHEWWTCRS